MSLKGGGGGGKGISGFGKSIFFHTFLKFNISKMLCHNFKSIGAKLSK